MKAKIFGFLFVLVVVGLLLFTLRTKAADPTTEPLLQQADLDYLGAFRLPDTGYSYGGTAITFNPNNNSLFAVGSDMYQYTGEIGIPQIINSKNINDLATAPVLQDAVDVTEGKRNSVVNDAANGVKIGGELVYNNKLILSAYAYYISQGNTSSSHFVSGLSLNQKGDVQGPFRVGNMEPGYVGGYMALIPPEWQSIFGAPALTGQCCISVISARSSVGPGIATFNPDDLGKTSPAPSTPLLFYPLNDPTYGTHQPMGDYYNGGVSGPYYAAGTEINGVAFPQNTRSVLFFGKRGTGPFCYGAPDQCNDPQGSKGPHTPPYVFQVWAYDANDFSAVKNGTKKPWEVMPYTGWTLDFPLGADPVYGPATGGVAYDPATQRIFVSELYGDVYGYARLPLIHVFKVNYKANKPEVNFSISSPSVNIGQPVTLSWNVSGATSISIDNGVGAVSPSGSIVVTPTNSTGYKITATNSSGTTTRYVVVLVEYPGAVSINSFTASPSTIQAGQKTTLSWTSTGGATAVLSYVGQVPPSGSIGVSPTTTTTYIITVANPNGYNYTPVTVTVSGNAPPPTTKTGDLNNDGKVDIFDYNALVGNFGKTGVGVSGGDIDGNGKVDIFDYNALVGNFGK